MKLLLVLAVLVYFFDDPSEAHVSLPMCLPALAAYLQSQENILNAVKSDLAATKQQLQQSIGQWPPGHYCILASGACPNGFTLSKGHMRALKIYAASASYITQATFGDSKIQCHGSCGQYGQWIGELYIAACCK